MTAGWTSRIGVRLALLAAVSAVALLGPWGARAQGTEDVGEWSGLSLDAFEAMLGRELPRPRPRPTTLAMPDGLIRPMPRPERLMPEVEPDPAPVLAVAELPPAPASEPVTVPDLPPVAEAVAEPPSDPAPAPALPAATAETPEAAPEPLPTGPQILPPPVVQLAVTEPEPAPVFVAVPVIKTGDFAPDKFWPDRRRLESELALAADKDRAAIGLELSRLMLSQMMLPEARSFHNRARQDGVMHDPALHQRWRVMEAMLDTLQKGRIEGPLPEGWDEAGLWFLATGADAEGTPPDLPAAVAQLQNHSEPVISALLPRLFAVALGRGDLRVAEGLLRGAREATKLPGTPIYHLMMGQLALAYDMPQDAFDYFVRATAGRDIHAQRARIALADLALHRKDPRLLPNLRDILSEGVNQWRHDYEALILRARLAQVAEDLGDIPLALDIMGKIRQDHPGTPEAILAHERGALALAAFAVAIDAEDISLTTYLTTLREVEPFYRLDPVWPIARQSLARAYERAGLHVAAASEYVALQIDINRVDAPVPPPRQRAEVAINEAKAWNDSHNEARARVALARNGLPRFEELQVRHTREGLRAGVTGAITAPVAFRELDDLVLLARAARAAAMPSIALAAWQEIDARGHLPDRPADALHAVLDAHDAGEAGTAATWFSHVHDSAMGQDFPARSELYTGLATPLPKLQPMSQGLAETMLARTDAALVAARELIARPVVPRVADTPAE